MYKASFILKSTRLDKELDIKDISKILKVPTKYLLALEADDISLFPQEPYCSLIIKDYADYLGLNGQEILKLFRRDFAQKRKTKAAKKSLFSFTPQFTFAVSTALLLLIFLGYLFSEYLKFNQPPPLKVNWPTGGIVLGSSLDINGTTDPESTISINQDLVVVDEQGNFHKKLQLSGSEAKITIISKSSSGKTTTDFRLLKISQ
jgi:hypothetical protein